MPEDSPELVSANGAEDEGLHDGEHSRMFTLVAKVPGAQTGLFQILKVEIVGLVGLLGALAHLACIHSVGHSTALSAPFEVEPVLWPAAAAQSLQFLVRLVLFVELSLLLKPESAVAEVVLEGGFSHKVDEGGGPVRSRVGRTSGLTGIATGGPSAPRVDLQVSRERNV